MKKTLLDELKSFFRKKVRKTTFSTFRHQYHYPSKRLRREVIVTVYLPPAYFAESDRSFPLLLINDGQDLPGMNFETILRRLYKEAKMEEIIAVGIHAGDRMQEYGTAGRPDYLRRGARAGRYTHFVLKELLPFLERNYRLRNPYAFAGWSLGGLSAFDIVWKHSFVFQLAGVFSGSFWWRAQPFNPDDPDACRIAHDMIRHSRIRQGLRFWLQTGTADETADRNNNGIIDSIDDTLDLIEALRDKGFRRGTDIRYVEVKGGRHDPQTWARIMPDFLTWSFPNLKSSRPNLGG